MKTSKLWDCLAKEKFSRVDQSFLANFREPGNANNRLAAWDPFDKSMRYFKFLFFHQLQTKDAEFFSNYAKIGDTSLGNPVTLKAASGQEVNLDHFFAVEEFSFLRENMPLKNVRHIIEIGAGFGRTAQALLRLVETLDKYTIIDIPEVLALSSQYLESVLDKESFQKLDFVNAFSLAKSSASFPKVDLVINIDSFQEMPRETVKYYFDRVIKDAAYFYSKNAVGKYMPESVGIYGVKKEQLLDVFSLGLSTDVIDIFSQEELKLARKKHVLEYQPSGMFKAIAQEPLGIFPYYQNVLYERNGT